MVVFHVALPLQVSLVLFLITLTGKYASMMTRAERSSAVPSEWMYSRASLLERRLRGGCVVFPLFPSPFLLPDESINKIH